MDGFRGFLNPYPLPLAWLGVVNYAGVDCVLVHCNECYVQTHETREYTRPESLNFTMGTERYREAGQRGNSSRFNMEKLG